MQLKELIDELVKINSQVEDDCEVIMDTKAWCFNLKKVKVTASRSFGNGGNTPPSVVTSVNLISNEDWSGTLNKDYNEKTNNLS